MEKKQTAVEKLELMLLGMVSFDSEELRLKYKKAFEQAKEMEKQQIIKTRQDIYVTGDLSNEQYYNQTFKQD
jgi:hypothetical protein